MPNKPVNLISVPSDLLIAFPSAMLRFTLAILLLLSGCVSQPTETIPRCTTKLITFYDGSTLRVPTTFTLAEEVGDSPVVIGSIHDTATNFQIDYRSGAVLGVPYDPTDINTRKKLGDVILNHGRGMLRGLNYEWVLARASSGQLTIYFSFPRIVTGFSAPVSSPGEIRRFKEIVLTFETKPHNTPDHALQRTAPDFTELER